MFGEIGLEEGVQEKNRPIVRIRLCAVLPFSATSLVDLHFTPLSTLCLFLFSFIVASFLQLQNSKITKLVISSFPIIWSFSLIFWWICNPNLCIEMCRAETHHSFLCFSSVNSLYPSTFVIFVIIFVFVFSPFCEELHFPSQFENPNWNGIALLANLFRVQFFWPSLSRILIHFIHTFVWWHFVFNPSKFTPPQSRSSPFFFIQSKA
jgi:hypothetical protein